MQTTVKVDTELAKKMGAKFAFGTNNTYAELGTCEYARKMVRECNLKKADMFIPEPRSKDNEK